ncbi:MAG: amidohydrolase family protein [Thermodesulfobacteriota bacterium]|nr:amidohydrolase family protein [Thermodesulfobacteriota bacterium]
MCSHPEKSCQIFRAPWVVPVAAPVIRDGAVVLNENSIVAVGSCSDISSRFSDLPQTSCSGVIIPALVNAHIHLDLSAYGNVCQESEDSTMCDWISALLQKRQQAHFSDEELKAAAENILQDQYDSGVGLLLDISNVNLGHFESCPVERVVLFEMLGPSKSARQAAISAIQNLPPDQAVTGHAPYSTTPELLKYIKERCHSQGELFSLHLSENPDEALLLAKGGGCFSQFLKERGGWDGTFPIPGIDSSGVVGYLHELGILDNKTICVHCVHLTTKEIRIIADSHAHVCFCPGSNRFLSVGTAPLEQFLKYKILPALGTDSIASNPKLDMWSEMSLLRQMHPDVSPEHIFSMATLGGAKAMHRDNDFGSLEQGRKASILHVQGLPYKELSSADQLFDRLTSCGRPDSITWLNLEL